MKKTILLSALFITLFAFSACNNDDDNETVQAPILGDWEISHTVVENVDIPIEHCEGKIQFSFINDGTVEIITHEENSSGECVILESGTAKWREEGNDTYTISDEESDESLEIIYVAGDDIIYYDIVIEGLGDEETIIQAVFARI